MVFKKVSHFDISFQFRPQSYITLKLTSSCLEKPWLWIILICLIKVLFPLSAVPDTHNPRDKHKMVHSNDYKVLKPTQKKDFDDLHFSFCIFRKVLLYSRALKLSLFTLFCNIPLDAQCCAALQERKYSFLSLFLLVNVGYKPKHCTKKFVYLKRRCLTIGTHFSTKVISHCEF